MKDERIPTYLFDEAGLADLYGFIDCATLLAFDFDGTLVPIAATPDGIRVPPEIREELAKLVERATVAVITGRARADAQAHIGFSPHFLIGNHGTEGLPGREASEADFAKLADHWERQVKESLSASKSVGIIIENKGATVSVHYRASPNRAKARLEVLRAIGCLVPKPKVISGKCVEDLVPETAPDKGDALLYLMNHCGYSKAFYAGDDKTDEDVFRLTGIQLFTVRVGKDAPTRALYKLRNQGEMHRLLREIGNALAGRAC
ncbi:MAG: trehalose-phosphatase [Deltaproteobacteria bacterium]|nr:trehalose-phosphatase [Deltaproteobacteria bacterium]